MSEDRSTAMDQLDLFDRVSGWTESKVLGAAATPAAPTACEGWDVRRIVNHLVETARFFTPSEGEKEPGLLGPDPPDLVGDDPGAAFRAARELVREVFGRPGAVEGSGQNLEIITGEFLIHGWDIAKGTGQDATMPADVARASWEQADGNLPDDKRGDFFGPAVPVPDDASPQDKLLAYYGRRP